VSPWLGIRLITKDTLSIFLFKVHHGRLHCRLASALPIQEELSLHKWPVPRVSDSQPKRARERRGTYFLRFKNIAFLALSVFVKKKFSLSRTSLNLFLLVRHTLFSSSYSSRDQS
jgi:hypothetical protein